MLKFISFGSGSSGNCYYLGTDADGLLIDAGVGIRALKKHFRDYGLSMESIHNIIITHDHADHVKVVGIISNDLNVHVYATEAVHKGITHNYSVHPKIDPEHVRYVQKNVTARIGEFEVTPFNVPHDSTDCVGYRIVCQGVTFCIITDVGVVTDEIKSFISQAEYLVIEANHDVEMVTNGNYPPHLKSRILSDLGHLSNAACGKALMENITEKLRHVWLCHISEENNHPELARKTVETILRSAGIVAGADFALDVLGRKTPVASTLVE